MVSEKPLTYSSSLEYSFVLVSEDSMAASCLDNYLDTNTITLYYDTEILIQ